MKRLDLTLRVTSDRGMCHDSRADSRLIMKCVNTIVSKLNEVIDENNKLKQEIESLKKAEITPA